MEMEKEACCTNKPYKFIFKMTGIVLIAAVLIVALVRDRIVSNPNWQVSVTGQGKVAYTPDVAKINFGVQVDKAASAEIALNTLNSNIEKVMKALTDLGIEQKNISTQNYSLYPQYDYIDGVSKPSGYSASEQVTVKIEKFAEKDNLIGRAIAEVTKAGVNNISGISFEAADIEVLKNEARLKAVEDAKIKAKEMSKSTGVRLGKVIGWWENYYPVDPYMDGKGGALMNESLSSASVPSSQYEVSVEVNLNYKVK
ncbi:SIMPL domain-containing protein [Patescibacteria group bacterium]|nr:SIMPL domain-containing protein [Patescibacteria group bacterium]